MGGAGDAGGDALVVEGLVKRYGATVAADGLGLVARAGEVTALLGPNGAGKTTAVECCVGLRRPDAGTVRVLGLDPRRDGARLRVVRSRAPPGRPGTPCRALGRRR